MVEGGSPARFRLFYRHGRRCGAADGPGRPAPEGGRPTPTGGRPPSRRTPPTRVGRGTWCVGEERAGRVGDPTGAGGGPSAGMAQQRAGEPWEPTASRFPPLAFPTAVRGGGGPVAESGLA